MTYGRSGLKFCALTIFALAGWLKIRLTARPVLIILTYHRILPKDHPARLSEQPGMVTSPEALQNHVRCMKTLGAVPTHLDEWLSKRSKGDKLPKLAVALTFDDGWRDNYQYAYPVLKAEEVPATVFLVSRFVDTDRTFWPEQVLQLLTTEAIPNKRTELEWLIPYLPGQRETMAPLSLLDADEVVSKLKELDDQTIVQKLAASHSTETTPTSGSKVRSILNSDELHEMASDGLVRYGAHTQNHFRLNRLNSLPQIKQEIVDCLGDLQPLGQAAVPIFCYPNGDITDTGEDLVEQHYQAACTTKTGWNPSDRDAYDLHRFNLHDGNSDSTRMLLATIGRGIL